ncbi:hypothetical protein SAMN02583745_01224 [Thorsellia anophelis DSM 18579]|uniref:Uncharacterized protein n=2 Tax=Thorsellia anophelis TaxID=336804 RepID=A0A1I0BAQ4_9GAMM|nr:hypothetical protein SAMN02583745_01224 [Thorsellia anophelis DSM 18579]
MLLTLSQSALAESAYELGNPLFVKIKITDVYHPLLIDADKNLVIKDFLQHLSIEGAYYTPKEIEGVTQKSSLYFERDITTGIGFDKKVTQITVPNQPVTIINRSNHEVILSIPSTVDQYWVANILTLELSNKDLLRTLLKDDEVDYLCLDGYLPSVLLRSENLSLESMDIDFNIGKCFHTPITFKFVVSIADSIEQLSQNMPDDKIADEKKKRL